LKIIKIYPEILKFTIVNFIFKLRIKFFEGEINV